MKVMWKYKIIVAGSREYCDYEYVRAVLNIYLSLRHPNIEIISGACSDSKNGVLTFTREDGTKVYGVDGLGERYAKEKGYDVKYFPAGWAKYGRSAGPRRNGQMARYANGCIVFSLNNSIGSDDMIKKARAAEIRCVVENV